MKEYAKLEITHMPNKAKILKNKEQLYHLKANVLCKSLNEYVQIKSFDKDKLSYQCKILSIKNQVNEKEDVREIVQDELTKIIEIQVKVVLLSG